jgi:phosphoglycerate dehydrogenase-like enzyme
LAPLQVLWCWPVRPTDPMLMDGLEIEYFSGTQSDLPAAASRADAILVRRGLAVDASVLAGATRLRYILRAGTNTGNIDLPTARARGLMVSATPMHIDASVAEHAIGLMLALAHVMVRAHDDVVQGRYRELHLTPEVSTETSVATNWMGYPRIPTLFGRRLGVVGLGEIGSAVAARARAFGMQITYHRRDRLAPHDELARGLRFASLVDLCSTSDFISLHVPDTHETVHLIDRARIASMAPTTYLVNVSRGRVVDEVALARALRAHRIAGAGLDVFEREPLPADSPLLGAPNVILTPHIASGTDLDLDVGRLLDNLRQVADGQLPQDLVVEPGAHRP